MNNAQQQPSIDNRSLQEVVSSLDRSRLEGEGYLVEDVLRLIGNPMKGLGLSSDTPVDQPVTPSLQATKIACR